MKQDRKAEMACTHYTPPITSSDKPLHVALALKGCSTRQRQRRTAPPNTGIEGLLRWAGTGSDGLLHLAPASWGCSARVPAAMGCSAGYCQRRFAERVTGHDGLGCSARQQHE